MQRRGSVLRRHGAAMRRLRARADGLVRIAVALAAAVSLSACASISQQIADTLSRAPAIGLSSSAPERPAEPPAYPAVHDVPPPRTSSVLTLVEQRKVEDDLVAARDRQKTQTGPVQAERKKPPPAAPRVAPTASSRTIY
jgi:hypothetical protein